MRTSLRILAALNALFQCGVGLWCVVVPDAAAAAFGLAAEQLAPSTLALTRMFGGLLVGGGLLSALVARDPERNPDLVLLAIIASVANVGADLLVASAGHMALEHLAAGMVLQSLLAIVATAYLVARDRPRTR